MSKHNWPEPESERIGGLFLILLAVTIIIFIPGCINRRIVQSYENYLNTAGQEYIHYVESDPELNDEDKIIRTNNHLEAKKVVKKFKNTKWSW